MAEDNRNRRLIIIVVVVLALVCFCCFFLWSAYFVWGDLLLDAIGY